MRLLLLSALLVGIVQTTLGATVTVGGIDYIVYISGSGYNANADSAYVGYNGCYDKHFSGSVANIASSVTYEYKWSEFVGYDQYGNKKYETRTSYLTAPVIGMVDSYKEDNYRMHGAFYGCESLCSAILPNTIKHIGSRAFSNCQNLTNVVLGNSVTTIGWEAFAQCSSLTDINLPNSIKSIGSYAFSGCTALGGLLIIPNSVTEIGNGAFNNCSSLSNLVLGTSLRTIGSSAFSNCNGLTCSLTIPNSVISIDNKAFYGCSGLTGVLNIPNSVTYIGSAAFRECSGITNVSLSSGMSTISTYIFYECSSLENVVIPNSVKKIESCAFYGCSNLDNLVIPSSVKTIEHTAFQGCSSLSSIIIPNSVTEIGDNAFMDCSNATRIHIGNSVSSIGSDAFTRCAPTELIWEAKSCSSNGSMTTSNIENASIGQNVEVLPDNIFSSSKITDITIPKSVKSIGNYAFFRCYGLKGELTIHEDVTYIGYSAFQETKYNKLYYNAVSCDIPSAPFSNTKITTIIIGNSVQRIPKNFAGYLTTLTSVNISNSVTEIGQSAFINCSALSNITIPNSVTSIGQSAFSSSGLKSVTIPCSVNAIGNGAFSHCNSLDTVYSYIKDPSLISMGTSVFIKYPASYSTRTLYVPFGTVEMYQADTNWSQYFGFVTVMPAMSGDVDGDGNINISDVTSLIDLLLRGGDAPVGADVNKDGSVNISDVTSLIDYLLSGSWH